MENNRPRKTKPAFTGGQGIGLSYIGKIAVVCILLVTIPFTAAALITGRRISRYLEQTTQQQIDRTLYYLNMTLDQYLENIREITVLPIFDSDLQSIFISHAEPEGSGYITFEEQRRVAEILSGVAYEHATIQHIDLYLLDGARLNSGSSAQKWGEGEAAWMQICEENIYKTFILPQDGSLIVARAVQEPMSEKLIGYIKIQLHKNAIESIVAPLQLPEGSQLSIYNEFDQCVYPLDAADVPSPPQAADSGSSEYVSGFVTSSRTNLNVLVRVDTRLLEQEIARLMGFVFIVIAVALLLSWGFALFASFRLAQPIISLKNKMELVSEGRFSTRAEVQSRDEIGQLENMFNSMTESVETLIYEVYETQIASKEAQISALQSQINPHFLYNTLETINMLAISKEDYVISQTASNLGQMMHYCVSNEQHFASLEEELEFVVAYYDIQKLRFEKLRSLSVEVGEECRRMLVPKLVLQPFVENIVQHGIGENSLDIVIKAEKDSDKNLIITVQNSGNPLTEEVRQTILQKLAEAEQKPGKAVSEHSLKKGYGLSNVHRRLQLIYGREYGISLDEGYKNGARFILRLRPRESAATQKRTETEA